MQSSVNSEVVARKKNVTDKLDKVGKTSGSSSSGASKNKWTKSKGNIDVEDNLFIPTGIENVERKIRKNHLKNKRNIVQGRTETMENNAKVKTRMKISMKKKPSVAISLDSIIGEANQIGQSDDYENPANSCKNDSPVTARLASIENSLSNNSLLKSLAQTSTRSSHESLSRIGTQDHCKLASWGLPRAILCKYESRGLTRMFPWQVDCLTNRELLTNNRNLVYSAPTSAGKTLVAEILVIKTVIERHKKVIFILPFVSVVREKMYYFQDLLSDSGVRVEGYMGGCSPAGGFAATDIAIATIEKANSLLNQLMEEGNLACLGAVVIDELHLLGDPYRGYLLELLLTKLKYMTQRDELVHVQLIGMSATLPNLDLLAKWLDAELYKTDFRPIPLEEQCKIGRTIYDTEMNVVRELPSLSELNNDSDNILQLCMETIADGKSVLIFCPTKNWCEKLAHQVALTFGKLGRDNTPLGRILREQLSTDAIVETMEQLKRIPSGLDDVLKSTVSFGTAFHHAGLTMDERDVIEGAFRAGALRVLTATSTLSSGVNLPARRVIIRSLMFHGKPLDILTYRQMIGRAGRMGRDTEGESILVCKSNETRAAKILLSSNLPPVESCLAGSEPLVRALLEVVASEVAYTANDIELYTRCTLLSHTSDNSIDQLTMSAIKFLTDNELLLLQTTRNGDERWVATQLGKACLAGSMPPRDGLFIFEELQKARRCFILDTELHIIYLVTPLNSSSQIGQIDWFVFLDLWKSISESERRVGQLVGVDENFLISGIRGTMRSGKILDIHKRFYTALALHELVREVPLVEVCRKYGCCRGVIQSLQQSAATFAGMVTQFCKKLGWNCMELLIAQFQARLQFGVCQELLDLLRLPMLNGLRARSLYKEGITSVAELALANELNVERALYKALPFESEKEHDGEHEYDAARRNKMRSVFVTGRDGLTAQEAARILVQEARTLVQNELGIDEVQWKQREQSTTISGKISNSEEMYNTKVIQDTMSNDSPKIGNFVENIQSFNERDRETEGEDRLSCEERSNKGSSHPEIVEAVDAIEKLGSKTTDSNKARSTVDVDCDSPIVFTQTSFEFPCPKKPDDQIATIESKRCEGATFNITNSRTVLSIKETSNGSKRNNQILTEGSFDFANFGNDINTKKVRNESKTREENCKEGSFDFASSGNAISMKDVVIGSKTNEEILEMGSFDFASARNAIDSKVVTIGSKTGEENCSEVAFEFTSSKITIDPKEDAIKLITAKDNQDIGEFSSSRKVIETKVVTIRSNTEEKIYNEDIFESAHNGNAVNPKVPSESSNSKKLGDEDVFEFSSRGNAINGKEVTIGSKTEEELCAEDIFEFTNSRNTIDLKLVTTSSKSSKEACNDEDIFQFSSSRNIPREVIIGSKTVDEMFKEGSFDFACTANKIDKTDNSKKINDAVEFGIESRSESGTKLIDGSKNHEETPQGIYEFIGSGNTPEVGNKLNESSKKFSASALLRRESATKYSDSRSPSLFGDSFNLDSEECNMLEQNVIDSLNVSSFGDTSISGFVESRKNTSKNNASDEARLHRQNSAKSQRFSLKNTSLSRSPRISELKNKSKSLVWEDDSWNNSAGIMENVDMFNEAINTRSTNTNKARDSETPPNPRCMEKNGKKIRLLSYDDRLTPKKRNTEFKKIPQKRKLSDSSFERSPLASSLVPSKIRNKSVELNKSDSDDIVVPSQIDMEMVNLTKSRSRLKLESLKKSRTQRAQRMKEKEKGTEETKENHYTDDFLCRRCSIEEIVSTLDVEIPPKGTNGPEMKTIGPVEKASITRKRLIVTEKAQIDGTKSKKPQTSSRDIQVINVTFSRTKFNQFKRDLTSQSDIALTLACEIFNKETISIGTKIIGITGLDGKKRTRKIENCVYGNKKICGVAITWDGIVVHYISFDNTNESKVPVKERLDLLVDILNSADLTIRCFSFKETYKILYNCCGIASSCKFLDPKTADWLLDPDHSERSFNALIADHFTEAQYMLQRTGPHLGGSGPGLNIKSSISSEIRATTESALTWSLTNILMTKLEERSATLLATFKDIEMGTLILLARMELTGLGVNLKALQELSEVVQQEMSELENKAYFLAGKKFNFSSSKSVAQVLGLYKGKKVSTNKAALKHCENPISSLVVAWRKLSATQIKMIFPLLRLAECDSRIHGNCVTNTVTGRVSMYDPNLQNVPRDFKSLDDSSVISVRMVFVPVHGNVMLSADYCQLELRILAHFSKEPSLCSILRKKGDVFKNIAARWYNVTEEQVDDDMRQRTKQLCYGMIYGMSVKTLAETLSISETEAKEFLETFMGAYPGIRPWLTSVTEKARADGYVTTLLQRRRFFPALNSDISSERSQAERQAVNTKVQGSAADIAKTAMVRIDERMRREFPEGSLVLKNGPIKRKLRSCTDEELPRGGYLILQIHDELLYEVNAADLEQVGRIIKESMEKSCELRVPLPVKLKVGPNWGDLTERNFETV